MFIKKSYSLPLVFVSLLVLASCDNGNISNSLNSTSSTSISSSSILSSSSSSSTPSSGSSSSSNTSGTSVPSSTPATEGLIFSSVVYSGKQSYVISGYEGISKDIILPSTFNNVDVVGISTNAFASKGITSIKFSETIKFVGNNAFSNNQLTLVMISTGVTSIGDNAFTNNQLASVTLPNSVQAIGVGAFSTNISTTIYAESQIKPEGWNQYWNGELFSGKVIWGRLPISFGEANEIDYIVLKNNLGTPYIMLVNSNKTGNVVIPSTIDGYTVASIGEYAFKNTQLATVVIPISVNTIEAFAFPNNQFLTIIAEASTRPTGWHQNMTNSQIVFGYISQGVVDGFSYVISSINGVNSVTIISSVNTGNVVIPSTIDGYPVTTLGAHSFRDKQITTVTIPNSVTAIGDGAFFRNQITTIIIPNSVTTIGFLVFDRGITIFAETKTKPNGWNEFISFGYIIFGYVSQGFVDGFSYVISSINGVNSVTIISSVNTGNVLIPSTIDGYPVTSISDYAFEKKQLTSVTIPNSVTSIGQYAFHDNQLTSVTIPNVLTTIGEGAFASNQLTSVTIPNNVIAIGSYAFAYNQISTVTIPNSVTSIGSLAFYLNPLSLVIIPNSVTTIGERTFNNQDNNVIIYAEAISKPVGWHQNMTNSEIIFGFVRLGEIDGFKYLITLINGENSVTIISSVNTGNVVIPSIIEGYPVSAIGDFAFAYITITSVTIPNSVTTIGIGAFAGSQLTSVMIPNSVTSIGDFAFNENQLTSVTIPNSVISIGRYAFAINPLTSVTIPNSVISIGRYAFSNNNDNQPYTIYVEAAVKPAGWNENIFPYWHLVTVIFDYKNK